MRIDLNCDMGEGFGVYSLGLDEEIMPFVTSINMVAVAWCNAARNGNHDARWCGAR